MSDTAKKRQLYGVMGEFHSSDELVTAIEKCGGRYTKLDAYTPIHRGSVGGDRPPQVAGALIVLIGGIIGGLGGFFLQYWVSVIEYPLNIAAGPSILGRRSFRSPSSAPSSARCSPPWPASSSSMAAPALPSRFNVRRFAFASRDRYFLCIESKDPRFDRNRLHELLLSVNAMEANDVEP